MMPSLYVLSQTVNNSCVLLGGGWPEMIMVKEFDQSAIEASYF